MTDPLGHDDHEPRVDATGVDADIVTNDQQPEPDEASPSEQGTDDDEIDVEDLP